MITLETQEFSRRTLFKLGSVLLVNGIINTILPKSAEASPRQILNGETIAVDKETGLLEGVWQNMVLIQYLRAEKESLKGFPLMTGFMLNSRIMITSGHGFSEDYKSERSEREDDNFGIKEVTDIQNLQITRGELMVSRFNSKKPEEVENKFIEKIYIIKGVDLSVCLLTNGGFSQVSDIKLPSVDEPIPSLTNTAGYGKEIFNNLIYGKKAFISKIFSTISEKLMKATMFTVLNDNLFQKGLYFIIKAKNLARNSLMPGDSGGPLIDTFAKKLFGINTMLIDTATPLPNGQGLTKIESNYWTDLTNYNVNFHLAKLFDYLKVLNLMTQEEVENLHLQ